MGKKNKRRTNAVSGKINSFRSKHPALRRLAVRISDKMDGFLFVYLLIISVFTLFYAGVTTLAIVLKLYTWEQIVSTAKPYLSAIWSLVAVIAFPIATNETARKREAVAKRYERNKNLYTDFSTLLIELLKENENFDKSAEKVKAFFDDHYNEMAIAWPQSLMWDAEEIYAECRYRCRDNIVFYIKRCLVKIRKEAGLKNDFSLNEAIMDMVGVKR